MVRWVEQGVPPETITAVAYNDNDAANGIGFTRPLCKVRLLKWGLLRVCS